MKINVKVCELCGALVADTPKYVAIHTAWHGKLKGQSPVKPIERPAMVPDAPAPPMGWIEPEWPDPPSAPLPRRKPA